MRFKNIGLSILLLATVLSITTVAQTSNDRRLPDGYVSDGCSMFPDCNYRECCVEHDKTYFFGGTKQERRAADRKLYECVRSKGRGFIAKMMWVGVRIGGVGFLPTSFRWGFGKDWKPKQTASPTK